MERRGSRGNARVGLGGVFCESAADFRGRDFPGERQIGADILPGVTAQMNVLQPAAPGATPLAAHWKRVDLLANRSPSEAAGDCELISEIKLSVLPLFTVRNVDYSATCVPGQLHTGTTRLTADVLVADASGATASR
jgi:hypothetical protein